MAAIRFTRFWAVRGWLMLVAVMLFVGRRVNEWNHIQHYAPSSLSPITRDDALDASLLLLFQPNQAAVGANPSLTAFGLRHRHSLPLIRGGRLH